MFVQDIIPLVSAVLMDPFAPSNPTLLLRGIKATQATILNCWPILSEEQHRTQVIRALSVCWVNLAEEVRNGSNGKRLELDALKLELKVTVSLLLKSAEETVDVKTEFTPLIDAYPDLQDLFSPEYMGMGSI